MDASNVLLKEHTDKKHELETSLQRRAGPLEKQQRQVAPLENKVRFLETVNHETLTTSARDIAFVTEATLHRQEIAKATR